MVWWCANLIYCYYFLLKGMSSAYMFGRKSNRARGFLPRICQHLFQHAVVSWPPIVSTRPTVIAIQLVVLDPHSHSTSMNYTSDDVDEVGLSKWVRVVTSAAFDSERYRDFAWCRPDRRKFRRHSKRLQRCVCEAVRNMSGNTGTRNCLGE